MRYMLKHTRNVLGAILIEVTNDSETWVKWTQDKITDMVSVVVVQIYSVVVVIVI